MTDAIDSAGSRDRSPAYPNIPLQAALERLVEFHNHFKRSPGRAETIGSAWGIKGKAYVDRTTAALRYFGLLDYRGVGNDRQIVVSEDGLKYLRAQQEETKQEVIKSAALRPKQIAKFWAIWGPDRPAKKACLDELMFTHGFSSKGASEFLRIYDDTIRFAGLANSDKLPAEAEDSTDEVTMVDPASGVTHLVAGKAGAQMGGKGALTADASILRRAVFTLDEGDVAIQFPAELSKESVEDLADYLETFMKRLRREAKTDEAAN